MPNCFCGNPQPSFRTFPGYIVRAYLPASHFWRMREYGVSFRSLGAEQYDAKRVEEARCHVDSKIMSLSLSSKALTT